MSLGACRAREICTFAKKECIGANEPGSEGESSIEEEGLQGVHMCNGTRCSLVIAARAIFSASS